MDEKLHEIITLIRIIGNEQHIMAINVNKRLQEIEDRLMHIEEKLQEFEVEESAASHQAKIEPADERTVEIKTVEVKTVKVKTVEEQSVEEASTIAMSESDSDSFLSIK